MSMLDRRLDVLIDPQQWARLQEEANRRKVSVSTLVREAIDERYIRRDQERRAALNALLEAEPMPVTDFEDLRLDLDEIRGRQGRR
jgi:predicted transcriptional regulator